MVRSEEMDLLDCNNHDKDHHVDTPGNCCADSLGNMLCDYRFAFSVLSAIFSSH
jgi:hypothetical protein